MNTSGLATQTQPLTVSFVGERTGNFTSFQTTIGEGTGHLLFGWSAANSMALYAQSNVETATATDSVLHAAQMFLNDVSSSFYIDGTSTGVGATPGTAFFSNVTLSIGNASSCSGGGFSLTGSLFEVGLWNGNQTSNNSTMNSNQHSYWGFQIFLELSALPPPTQHANQTKAGGEEGESVGEVGGGAADLCAQEPLYINHAGPEKRSQ